MSTRKVLKTLLGSTSFSSFAEFDDVQTHLVACLGLSFARSAASNQDFHVAKRVIALVPKRLPSAVELDNYIQSIATENKLEWSPPPHRQHMCVPSSASKLSWTLTRCRADPLAVILRPGDPPSVIDLEELRKLCFQGPTAAACPRSCLTLGFRSSR